MRGSPPAAAPRPPAWPPGPAHSDFEATVAFYTGLADARWQGTGEPVRTPASASLRFTDATGVLAFAAVTIARTDPVRVNVAFGSTLAAETPPPASGPTPTIAFATLPPATELPAGFPSALVPDGASLTDAAEVDGAFFAIFAAPTDQGTLAAAYQAALTGYASDVITHLDGASTVIDFTTAGGPGEIVISPVDGGGMTVGVQVRP